MIQTVSQKVATVIHRRREICKLQDVLDELNTKRARVSYVNRILKGADDGIMSAQLIMLSELFLAVAVGDFDWCFTPIPEMLAKWCAEKMSAAGVTDEPPKPVVAVVPEEEANAVVVAVVPEEEVVAVVVMPEEEANAVVPLTADQIKLAKRASVVSAALERIYTSEKDEETQVTFRQKFTLHETTRSMMNDIAKGEVDTKKMTALTIHLLEIKVEQYDTWLAQHVKELAAKKNKNWRPSYYQ